MTPTARTLALLRRSGYVCDVVERWLAAVQRRKDFLGCIDLLAVRRGESGVLAIQATSDSNLASRLTKARSEPRLRVWLAAGNRYECWGWEKRSGRWTVRRVAVTGEDLAVVAVGPLPPAASAPRFVHRRLPLAPAAAPRRHGRQGEVHAGSDFA